MDLDKRKRLEAAGWTVGTSADFLGLSPVDQAFIEIKLQLSHALRAVRAKAELTQQQVARRIGSSQSRVAKMEAGDPSVSLDLLVRSLLTVGSSASELGTMIAGAESRSSKRGAPPSFKTKSNAKKKQGARAKELSKKGAQASTKKSVGKKRTPRRSVASKNG